MLRRNDQRLSAQELDQIRAVVRGVIREEEEDPTLMEGVGIVLIESAKLVFRTIDRFW